jgi:hypothetical protein
LVTRAVAFLTEPNAALSFWCAHAGLNPAAVRERARRLLA